MPHVDDPDDDVARARLGRLGDILDPEIACGVEAKGPQRPILPRRRAALASAHGTIRSARRRAKRSVNEDRLSRTPRKPSRLLRPMSVNVSIVRPRSASVCHHEARLSTLRSRRPWRRTISGQTSAGVGHLLLERGGLSVERHGLDAERGGEPRPHSPPAEDVAVDDVERLVRRGRRRRRPDEVVGQEAGVGHVGDRLPLLARAGEVESAPRLAADRRVHGERHPHVHRVPEGPADERVRPMHRPRESVALGSRRRGCPPARSRSSRTAGGPAPRRTACPAEPSRTPRTARGSA